jgi:hypothetical protein
LNFIKHERDYEKHFKQNSHPSVLYIFPNNLSTKGQIEPQQQNDNRNTQHSTQNSSNTIVQTIIFFFLKNPIYLQSVTIHSANGGKGEGWHVEEYSVALLCE